MRISLIICLTFITGVTEARNVYFYHDDKPSAQTNVNDENTSSRKIYVFESSKVHRQKTYDINSGFTAKTASIDFMTGYRRGDFLFNIGIPNSPTFPNVLSELEWDAIEIYQFSTNGSATLWNNLRFGLDFDIGFIDDGTVRDSDYLLDNRQAEFSRSFSSVAGHGVVDASLYTGYAFDIPLQDNNHLILSPLFGYSYHEQNLQFRDGVQVINSNLVPVPLGPFQGLNSEYKANWHGPWLGLEAQYYQGPWNFSLRYSHHWADYEADGRWNLRSDFAQPKSFEHDAEGSANRINFTASRHWQSNWHGLVSFGIESWKGDSGRHRVYFSNGTISERVSFNEVEWDSWWATIGLKRYF